MMAVEFVLSIIHCKYNEMLFTEAVLLHSNSDCLLVYTLKTPSIRFFPVKSGPAAETQLENLPTHTFPYTQYSFGMTLMSISSNMFALIRPTRTASNPNAVNVSPITSWSVLHVCVYKWNAMPNGKIVKMSVQCSPI